MAEPLIQRLAVPEGPAATEPRAATTRIEVERLSLHYGAARALVESVLKIPERLVTAFIGPSGCGKST